MHHHQVCAAPGAGSVLLSLLARVGAGDGDLQDRCLGRWRGGDDSVLVPGDLDLLVG